MLVVKIGGSIQREPRDYELIIERIKKLYDINDKIYLVVSAIKDVTNLLLDAINNIDKATDIVTEVYDKHIKLLSKLVNGNLFETSFREISRLTDELYKIVWSIRVLDEVTPRVRDYILSFGERISSILMASMLKSRGFEAELFNDAPFITDENYGEANVIEELSKKNLQYILTKKSKIIVIPGFIGKTVSNRFTTLGRGGSDYTATLLGKLLGCNEVRLITEVPGIMTGDPKKFKNSKTISRLSLEEAIELSQLGAKKLHPRTFEPLFGTSMRVIIEGLYESNYTIVEGMCSEMDTLKGVTILDELKMITIESMKIVGKIGSAATILTEAKNAGVNIIAMSQPASETSIHLVVRDKDSKIFKDRLQGLVDVLIKDITEKDVTAVSVIGCGLRSTTISREVVNVGSRFDPIFTSRGLKNTSITFIVEKENADKLAEELHEVVLKWIR
jgi:aspartate kinase